MSFWEVTLFLMDGFYVTCMLFALTLIFALPLGLIYVAACVLMGVFGGTLAINRYLKH